jgi:hypothetical protein
MIWLTITKSVYPSQLDTITNERIDTLCGKSLLLPSCFPHHPYAQKQQHLLLDQVEKKSPETKNKKREMGCLLL